MDIEITGFGTAHPSVHVSQDVAGEAAVFYCCEAPEQARSIRALFRSTGVENRYSVVLKQSEGTELERQSFYQPRTTEAPRGPTTGERMQYFERTAGTLALQAATRALQQSRVAADMITHLITVSCSGFAAPGFDQDLIQHLPLRPTLARTQVGFMGCHAALNALRVARAFVAADPNAIVLVCCVELSTLHYQYGWDPEQIVANALFADGAAACVVQSSTTSDVTGTTRRFRVVANGSCILPDSRDAMTWRIGDHGFRMTLSPTVPGLLAKHLSPWLTEWLSRHGRKLSDIQSWAVHPGGPRILRAFADAMQLPPDCCPVSHEILRQYGNMSSPTLLFILNRLAERNAPRPCVAIGFGPGLAAEAAMLE